MKFIGTVIFSLLSFSIYSQNNDFFEDTIQRLNISAFVEFNYGSSAMSSEFTNRFIFGGKIDRDLKSNAYDRLSDNNRLGGDLNYNFNIEIPVDTIFKNTNISLVFGAGHREHFDANFTRDLFKFTFDGNKQFAGQSADISNTNFNYYRYQEIQFGFVNHKKTGNKIAKEGAILSLIKAEEYQAISIPEGSIFTEENGREIELDLNYIYNSSDTASKGSLAFNGFGVSTDLFTEFFLKNGDKIFLGVEDLGFIQWNNKSIENGADSVFYYQGIVVDNIFDLNDSLLSDISKDSILANISSVNEKGSYSIALPTAINISYTKYLSDKFKINVGFYHKILSNYFPLFYTNTYYYFNKSIAIKAHISYGGYGKLNTGLAFATSIKNRYNFFVGSNNIESIVVPGLSFANSGYIGVKVYF
jgi:Family of unknown function (DUF5723)